MATRSLYDCRSLPVRLFCRGKKVKKCLHQTRPPVIVGRATIARLTYRITPWGAFRSATVGEVGRRVALKLVLARGIESRVTPYIRCSPMGCPWAACRSGTLNGIKYGLPQSATRPLQLATYSAGLGGIGFSVSDDGDISHNFTPWNPSGKVVTRQFSELHHI